MNHPPTIPADLLTLLRCPVTHSRLVQHGNELVAEVGGRRYPIRDGIPVLLADEAHTPPVGPTSPSGENS